MDLDKHWNSIHDWDFHLYSASISTPATTTMEPLALPASLPGPITASVIMHIATRPLPPPQPAAACIINSSWWRRDCITPLCLSYLRWSLFIHVFTGFTKLLCTYVLSSHHTFLYPSFSRLQQYGSCSTANSTAASLQPVCPSPVSYAKPPPTLPQHAQSQLHCLAYVPLPQRF